MIYNYIYFVYNNNSKVGWRIGKLKNGISECSSIFNIYYVDIVLQQKNIPVYQEDTKLPIINYNFKTEYDRGCILKHSLHETFEQAVYNVYSTLEEALGDNFTDLI